MKSSKSISENNIKDYKKVYNLYLILKVVRNKKYKYLKSLLILNYY